jgi:hypothetical protein
LIFSLRSVGLDVFHTKSGEIFDFSDGAFFKKHQKREGDCVIAIREMSKIKDILQSSILVIASSAEEIEEVKTKTEAQAFAIVGETKDRSSLFETCSRLSVPLAFTPLGIGESIDMEDALCRKFGSWQDASKFDQRSLMDLSWLLAVLNCSTHVFGNDPDRAVSGRLIQGLESISIKQMVSEFRVSNIIRNVWRRNLWTFCECCAAQIIANTASIHEIHQMAQKIDFFRHGYFHTGATDQFESFGCSIDFSILNIIYEMAEEALDFLSENCNISLVQLNRNCAPLTQYLREPENKQFFSKIDWTVRDSVVRAIRFCKFATQSRL